MRKFKIRLPVILTLLTVSTIATLSLLSFMWAGTTLPQLVRVKDYQPLLVTEIFSKDGYKVGEFFKERRYLISLDQIPPVVMQAFVASEDLRFFEHSGVDLVSISRAFFKNMKAGKIIQGGSTITQQVAKSLMLSAERTLQRKLKEAVLAWRMEQNMTKEEILYLYLNQIYLGEGAYGIEAAARTYFGKSAGELSISEAALLAGLPQAPSRYSPLKHPKLAEARQKYVLEQMVKGAFISQAQAEEALQTPLYLKTNHREFEDIAPYFVALVRQSLIERFGYDAVYRSGLKVYTTLISGKQKAANEAVGEGLKEIDRRSNHYGPIRHLSGDRAILQEIESTHAQLSPENRLLPGLPFHTADSHAPQANPYLDKNFAQGSPACSAEGVWSDCPSKEHVGSPFGEIFSATSSTPLAPEKTYPAVILYIDRSAKFLLASVGHMLGLMHFQSMPWVEGDAVDGESRTRHSGDELKKGDIIPVSLAESKETKGNLPTLPKWVRAPEKMLFFKLEPAPAVQGALFAFDSAGAIEAMVGGRDFLESEFNRATQALRQPGSIFKPMIYAAAIDRGYTPVSVILDSPLIYGEGAAEGMTEETWKPHNFGEKFYGDTLFRTALVESRNIPTVRIAQTLGLDYVAEYARTLGIKSPLNLDLSLALGSSALTLKELCSAYAVFLSGGIRVEPYAIAEVKSRDGKSLYRHAVAGPSEQVLSPQTAYVMTHLLQDVIRYGTGKSVAVLGKSAAGKTGTSNDFIDAWFIGYTPHRIAGVWTGYDDRKSLGKGETGARAAAPIWLKYMLEATKNDSRDSFQVPEEIVFANIDSETGEWVAGNSPRAVYVAFKAGTEPTAKLGQPPQASDGAFFREELSSDTQK